MVAAALALGSPREKVCGETVRCGCVGVSVINDLVVLGFRLGWWHAV